MEEGHPDQNVYSLTNRISREKIDHLPPLINDAREKFLASRKVGDIRVLVKDVATPYSKNHLLVIPDNLTGNPDTPPISNITLLSDDALSGLLNTSFDVANQMMENPDLAEVDLGFNYSEFEDSRIKQRLASVPKNLHVHVTGYTNEELKPATDKDIAFGRKTSRLENPLSEVATELFEHLVLPSLEKDFNI